MFTPNSGAEFLYYKTLQAAPRENLTQLPGFKRWQKLKESTSWPPSSYKHSTNQAKVNRFLRSRPKFNSLRDLCVLGALSG